MNFEEKFRKGYEEYLKLPEASCGGENYHAELYTHNWCVRTGVACMHPHPHRYYDFLEFVFWCGRKQNLYDRFIKPLNI